MVSTFITVSNALDEAGLSGPDDIRRICLKLDECCVDFGCERVEVVADNETATLDITLYFDDIIMEYGRSHPFFQAIKGSCLLEFFTKDELPVVRIVYEELNRK